MKFEKGTSGIERDVGFDIHKEYALVGGQNARQEWVTLAPRRGWKNFVSGRKPISIEATPRSLRRSRTCGRKVVKFN